MSGSVPRRSKRRKIDHVTSLGEGLAKSATAVAEETAEVAEKSHKSQRKQWMSGIRVPGMVRPKSSYKVDAKGLNPEIYSEQAVLDQLIVRRTWAQETWSEVNPPSVTKRPQRFP